MDNTSGTIRTLDLDFAVHPDLNANRRRAPQATKRLIINVFTASAAIRKEPAAPQIRICSPTMTSN